MMKKLEAFLQKNWSLVLVGVFLLSVAIRLVYLWQRGEYTVWEGDEGFFGQIAENLVSGRGYTHKGVFYTPRMPLMAILTAGFSLLTGGFSIAKAHVFGVLLGSLIPVTIAVVAVWLVRSYSVAVTSAVYCVFYPFFIHEASFLDTENVFIPLFVLYFGVLARLEKSFSWQVSVAAGILLGLSVLTRPTLSVFLAFYTLYLFLKRWPLKKIVLNIFIQSFCFIVLLAPWSYALSMHAGKLSFLTQGTNAALIGGTNPVVLFNKDAAGEWVNLGRDFPEVERELEALAPGKGEVGKVLAVMQKYPKESAWLMVQKLKKLWGFSPKHYTNRNLRDDLIGLVSYGLLLPLLLIVVLERKFPAIDLFVLMASYFSFMTLVTSGTMRFRLPLDPLIILMVVWYIFELKGVKHGQSTNRRALR